MKALLLLSCLAFGLSACALTETEAPTTSAKKESAARKKGEREARRDLKRGKLVIKETGLQGPWVEEYWALMKSRYGVDIEAVVGCIVSKEVSAYADAYNKVAFPEIQRRFGKDVVPRTDKIAEEHYRKTDPEDWRAWRGK